MTPQLRLAQLVWKWSGVVPINDTTVTTGVTGMEMVGELGELGELGEGEGVLHPVARSDDFGIKCIDAECCAMALPGLIGEAKTHRVRRGPVVDGSGLIGDRDGRFVGASINQWLAYWCLRNGDYVDRAWVNANTLLLGDAVVS